MDSYSLEAAAEDLVAAMPRDKKQPHYTEETFSRKLRYAHANEPDAHRQIPPRPQENLAEFEMLEAASDAGLTESQMEVLKLRMEGLTFLEIGELRGHTKQGAMSIFARAKRKLLAVWNQAELHGIAGVYADDQKRKGKPSAIHRHDFRSSRR
jgi:DNA-directed RNA polymerase specialized sigma24 family protein